MRNKQYDLTPEQQFANVINKMSDLFNEASIDPTDSIQSLCGDGVFIVGRYDIEKDEDTSFEKAAFDVLISGTTVEVLEQALVKIVSQIELLNNE